jgi:uncharacterized protein YegL
MLGEGMDSLQKGLSMLMMDLHSDPHALETAWLSVITFSDTARQVLPLTELFQARIPPLSVRPGTSLGAALDLLQDCIAREVRTHSETRKGDWKPMVFLLTDGNPTDRWEEAAARLKSQASSRPMNLIAIGCGDEVDPYVLMQVSNTVLRMDDNPESFVELFQWISSSLKITSQAVSGASTGPISLEKLPEGIEAAEATNAPRATSPLQPQLFMAMRCARTRRPYLMRYRLNDDIEVYQPVRTHIIEEDYFAGTSTSEANLSVSSSQIVGILPCPHCSNDGAGRCACGQLFCTGEEDEDVTCPGCHASLTFGGSGGDFQVSGRLG